MSADTAPDEASAQAAAQAPRVIDVTRLDLAYEPRPWPFAEARRAEIDAYFASLMHANPALYNGTVLLMHRHVLAGGVLSGAFLRTDFASYLAWRDWGFPDPSVRNCFAQGALRGSDGAFLLGEMGAHTSNAGRVYFPSGTPDPDDISGGRVDMMGSVLRELAEETGLHAAALDAEPGWTAVTDGARIALMKVLRSALPAAALRRHILASLAGEAAPEFTDFKVVCGPSDLTEASPPFIHAFLQHLWRREGENE